MRITTRIRKGRGTLVFCMLMALGLLLLVSGCDPTAGLNSAYGSVRLRIVGPPARQSGPDNTDITHVRIYGIGPSGRTIDPPPVEIGVSEILIEDLVPGAWVFHVDALNSDGVPILTGQADVFIAAGERTTANITLGPISGTGTLVVEFTWPVESLDDGEAAAALARYEQDDFGVPELLAPFVSSEANGIELQRYAGQHAAGYYRLDTVISDTNGTAFSDTTIVRILADLTTAVTIDLETGDVEFIIVLNPPQPLTVGLTADPSDPLSPGEDVIVTAVVSGGTGSYTYRWYLDGDLLVDESDAVVELGAALDPGRYRLTLIASDGEVLGSAGVVFDIKP